MKLPFKNTISLMKLDNVIFPLLQQTRNQSAVVEKAEGSKRFETVFSFPFVKSISIFNRLKVYHLIASSIIVPSCTAFEILGTFPQYTFVTAAYIGVTGGILLSLGSIPFKNTIGFLYVSDDNKEVKISSVDFWGRRKDRIISADDWIPLLDIEPKVLDAVYLTPRLKDGTTYKLFVKFGKVLNSHKMGTVLE